MNLWDANDCDEEQSCWPIGHEAFILQPFWFRRTTDSIRVSEAPDPSSILGEATINTSMYYAYVIKSLSHEFYYKGHCENLEARLKQHNSGMTESIRPYAPFQIVYFEEFPTREQAIIREKYFKSSAGRRFLKKVIT